jgi:hypothetical protein
MKNQPSLNYVEVCAERCEFDESASTASEALCKIPKISTTYSNENFKIEEPSDDLNSGKYFGTNQDNSVPFDNNLLIPPVDENADCHFGMEFKEGHVAMISQVKFFMGDIADKTVFVGKVKF